MQGLGNLLDSALRRHGITKQVTATMIVLRANELLQSICAGPLMNDVKVVSYKNNELYVACRHSAASFDVQPLLPRLRYTLEQSFPDKTFAKIYTRISTAEWYNNDDNVDRR
jgi:hypothetical protein